MEKRKEAKEVKSGRREGKTCKPKLIATNS